MNKKAGGEKENFGRNRNTCKQHYIQEKRCIQKLTAEDGPSVNSTIATAACQESW